MRLSIVAMVAFVSLLVAPSAEASPVRCGRLGGPYFPEATAIKGYRVRCITARAVMRAVIFNYNERRGGAAGFPRMVRVRPFGRVLNFRCRFPLVQGDSDPYVFATCRRLRRPAQLVTAEFGS